MLCPAHMANHTVLDVRNTKACSSSALGEPCCCPWQCAISLLLIQRRGTCAVDFVASTHAHLNVCSESRGGAWIYFPGAHVQLCPRRLFSHNPLNTSCFILVGYRALRTDSTASGSHLKILFHFHARQVLRSPTMCTVVVAQVRTNARMHCTSKRCKSMAAFTA